MGVVSIHARMEEMRQLLKISQQTGWQVLGKIITSVSTFIILGVVTRNYGEEGTGVFTLALTYLAILYLLSDFGFNAHVLRKFSIFNFQFSIEWRKLLGTRIIWSVILVVLAVGLLPFWPFATKEFSQAIMIGSLAIVGSGVFVTCNLIFQSKLRYDLSVLASSTGTIISLVVFVYLIWLKYPIPFLMLAHLLGWTIIAMVAFVLIRKIGQVVFPIYDKQYTINLFKTSWPIAATLALNVVYFRADSFMISYFRSNAEVGIYNVAYSVFQTALVLPTFIMNAYYPMMLKSFKGIKIVALGLLVIASGSTLLVLILAPFISKLLTGGGFLGTSLSLQILSLGFPAYFLSALLMWIMVTQGRYKIMLIIYAVGLVVNLVLNLIYIPQYSFVAASWITVISEYVILMLQGVVLWFERR
ncbi:flippase [Candidatus Microgenomates bacterium]|nr:flippase [Candidatus Microgenomates bacterium]